MKSNQFLERPTKEEIRELPKFDGLPLEKICLIQSSEDVIFAQEEILKSTHLGFDTESKPNFVANQPSTGPHVLQVSTENHAFLFMPNHRPSNDLLIEIIQSERLIKVGFGLKSDKGPIFGKLGVKLRSAIELSGVVKQLGYEQTIGLQTAVAVVLGQYLQKSKKTTLSNWSASPLSTAQKLYAANDAYASLRVYLQLSRVAPHLLHRLENLVAKEAGANGRAR